MLNGVPFDAEEKVISERLSMEMLPSEPSPIQLTILLDVILLDDVFEAPLLFICELIPFVDCSP